MGWTPEPQPHYEVLSYQPLSWNLRMKNCNKMIVKTETNLTWVGPSSARLGMLFELILGWNLVKNYYWGPVILIYRLPFESTVQLCWKLYSPGWVAGSAENITNFIQFNVTAISYHSMLVLSKNLFNLCNFTKQVFLTHIFF